MKTVFDESIPRILPPPIKILNLTTGWPVIYVLVEVQGVGTLPLTIERRGSSTFVALDSYDAVAFAPEFRDRVLDALRSKVLRSA
jgi:hypothetical protein